MTSKQICRVGDTVTGTCRVPNAQNHPRQFTGVWQTGSSMVKCDGIPVVRVGDSGVTDCGHTFHAVEGSSTTIDTTNGKALHRVGDAVTVDLGGEGVSVTGSGSSSSN